MLLDLTTIRYIVDGVFSFGLFFNAALFIPQALQIWRQKSAKGVSLFTFLGFNIMQLFTVLHGYLERDYLLAGGFLLSLITCGMVTYLTWKYR